MILTANVPGIAEDDETGADERASHIRPHFAPAARIEVIEESEGCFLFCYDRHGKVAGDYWFSTLEDAKMQAKHEFSVAEEDWRTRTEEKTPIFLTLVRKHFTYLTEEYGFVIVQESDYSVIFETDQCLVKIGSSWSEQGVNITLESREREIIRRKRAQLADIVRQEDPDFRLPPLSLDNPQVCVRDRDGNQERQLGILAALLKQYGDKMLRGDFFEQPPIAGGR